MELSTMDGQVREHGGPDAEGAARWDFSSNANACGPCPTVLQAVRAACPQRYPDPRHTRLRAALAAHHGVDAQRVVIAASASEFIQRITAWRWRDGDRRVWIPAHAYGDYAHAARAWGWHGVPSPEEAQLRWLCDPGSPLGKSEAAEVLDRVLDRGSRSGLRPRPPCTRHPLPGALPATVVLDCAYAPLRQRGCSAFDATALQRVWQLWSPNKALGMTGVRAAYAIAPRDAADAVLALDALAPSWPIGSHGEAMLLAWTRPSAQSWLADSLLTLAAWTQQLRQMLTNIGWTCAPSDTHYFCGRPPAPLDAHALRAHGVKLRDATSFGLPGWWRLSAQPPAALAALAQALDQNTMTREHKP